MNLYLPPPLSPSIFLPPYLFHLLTLWQEKHPVWIWQDNSIWDYIFICVICCICFSRFYIRYNNITISLSLSFSITIRYLHELASIFKIQHKFQIIHFFGSDFSFSTFTFHVHSAQWKKDNTLNWQIDQQIHQSTIWFKAIFENGANKIA